MLFIIYSFPEKNKKHSFAFQIIHNNFIPIFSLGKQHIQMRVFLFVCLLTISCIFPGIFMLLFFLIILLEIPIKYMSEIQSCIMFSVVKQH